MDSDMDDIETKAKALEAAGVAPEQVDLAVRTSATLHKNLGNAQAERDDLSVKDVYTEFAGTDAGQAT